MHPRRAERSDYVPFLQDLRYSLRQLFKNPGVSLTAILSLALGIGATVSVFSLIYSVLLNPWPYQGADRIAQVALLDKSGEGQNYGLNGLQTRELAKAKSLEYVVGINGWNLTVTGSDVPEDVQAIYITGNGFQMLGVPAMLGRYFLPSDARDGQDPQPVIVLSYKFWKRHYNGDRSIVGSTIQLVHKTYTVIGVMPPHFGFLGPDVYLPLKLSDSAAQQYGTFIKLRTGVKPEAAATELKPYFQEFRKANPRSLSKGLQKTCHTEPELLRPADDPQNPLSALWRRRPAAGDRLRKRLDPAAGARHGPPA